VGTWIARRGLTDKAFVETMLKNSGGNFMYLSYVLGDIEGGEYGAWGFGQLPVGLENYYENHWRQMGMATRSLSRTKIKIIYILSAVQKPVSRTLLADFAGEDELTVQEVLTECRPFLARTEAEGQKRYSLYHESFREFLHRSDVIEAAGMTWQGIHDLISGNLLDGLNGEQTDRSTEGAR